MLEVLAHEIGHILNLIHVDQAIIYGGEGQCIGYDDYDICEESGDCCCDTKVTHDVGVVKEHPTTGECYIVLPPGEVQFPPCVQSWNLKSLNLQGLYLPEVDNVMRSGPLDTEGACYYQFSTDQIHRMRNAISSRPHLQDLLTNEDDDAACCLGPLMLGTTNVDDLMKVLNITDVDELTNINIDITIDGTFNINRDIVLNGLNFILTEDSDIRVLPGVSFVKEGGYIKDCNGQWKEIYVNDADISLTGVDIIGSEYGVRMWNSTGAIDICKIDKCTYGIYMTQCDNVLISGSHFDCSFSAISAYANTSYTAFDNIIGATTKSLYSIYEDQSVGEIVENQIYSDYTGIYSIYNNSHIYHNDIYVQNGNSTDRGISFFLSDGDILDNSIYTDGSYAGIYLNGNTADNNIEFNLIDGAAYSSILLQGSNHQIIGKNLIEGNSDYGVRAFNSGDNEYHCNDISVGDYGLAIVSGSGGLNNKIITNTFQSADLDFYNEVFLGDQWYEDDETGHGNTEWRTAQSTIDPQFAKFEVSSTNWMPSVTGESGGLFSDIKANDDAFCEYVGVGPRTYNPGWICLFINHLEETKSASPNSYWYGTYQFLRRYLLKLPQEEWPECLWMFYYSIEECGLIELVEADVAYRGKLKELATTIADLAPSGNPYIKASNSERLGRAQQFKSAMAERQLELETLRQSQVQTITDISCTEEIFVLWRQTYLMLMKHQSTGLSEEDLDNLKVTAALCATEYGDAVHWAEGLVSAYIPHYFSGGNCGEDIQARSLREKSIADFRIYPNPAKDQLAVEINDYLHSSITLKDISGKIILAQKMKDRVLQIELGHLPAGLYFIEKRTGSNSPEIKKLIVHE